MKGIHCLPFFELHVTRHEEMENKVGVKIVESESHEREMEVQGHHFVCICTGKADRNSL